MPRKNQGWVTFQCSLKEMQLLQHYCQQSQRTKTDVLRSLIRSLHSLPLEQQVKQFDFQEADIADIEQWDHY